MAAVLASTVPGSWVSHSTAAQLHGLWVPAWLGEDLRVHLSREHTFTGVRRGAIVGHHVRVLPDETELLDGIPISTRSRTWLDLARRLPLEQLVCLGDQLIRIPRFSLEGRVLPYATVSSLRAMVAGHPNLQGVRRAREALDLMRVGSDSAPETLLRLAIVAEGLPEPDLQVKLDPEDPRSPSSDLGYRWARIAMQYDGAHHLTREQQTRDNRRDEGFQHAGWTYFKFNADDLRDDFHSAVSRLRQVLRSANPNAQVVAKRGL